LKGASSLYPIAVGGTDLNWDGSGKGGVSGGKVEVENIDYDPNVTTGGGAITLKLTGDCEFDAVTVSSGDTLDLNGQRMECSALLTNAGTIDYDGLIDAYDIADTGTANNTASCDIMFSGIGASDVGLAPPAATFRNFMINTEANGKIPVQYYKQLI